MSKIHIGIDPGKLGGIAWFDMEGKSHAIRMPATERDLWEAIHCLNGEEGAVAYVERVTAIHPGVKNVCSIVKLQANYYQIRMALVASYIPLESPTPRQWQNEFGLIRTNKSESDTDKKNRHKARAQELFPHLKITHAIADALLIAECCRRNDVDHGS